MNSLAFVPDKTQLTPAKSTVWALGAPVLETQLLGFNMAHYQQINELVEQINVFRELSVSSTLEATRIRSRIRQTVHELIEYCDDLKKAISREYPVSSHVPTREDLFDARSK